MCHSVLVRIAGWIERDRVAFFSLLPTRGILIRGEKNALLTRLAELAVLALICMSLTMEQTHGFIEV